MGATPIATISERGKLMFNDSATRLLGLDLNRYMSIASDERFCDGSVLYLIPGRQSTQSAFKVSLRGSYAYVSMPKFFESVKLDFAHKVISYSMSALKQANGLMWLLRKQEFEMSRSPEAFGF